MGVHKKKVAEIKQWLLQQHRKILILHGPPGTGKSTCVRVLCAQLGYEISDWVSETSRACTYDGRISDMNFVPYVSDVDDFEHYLDSACKFPSLELAYRESDGNVTKPIASKVTSKAPDASSSSIRSPTPTSIADKGRVRLRRSCDNALTDLRQKLERHGSAKVVLLYSCDNGESARPKELRAIFGNRIVDHPWMKQEVRMNPMSTTGIRRVLQRALKNSSKRVAPNIVKSIEGNSNGDVRHALNMLQFVSLGGPSAILSSSSPRTWGSAACAWSHTRRDGCYAPKMTWMQTPQSLRGAHPTMLVRTRRQTLLSFMQFNALDHIGSCEDLEAAFDAFSAADILSAQSSKRCIAATARCSW